MEILAPGGDAAPAEEAIEMRSAVHVYSDPGEATACYAAAQVQLTPTGRMPFRTRAVRGGIGKPLDAASA